MAKNRFFVRIFTNGSYQDIELSGWSILNAVQSLYEINPAILASLDTGQLANIETAKREFETIGQEVWKAHYANMFS